MESTHAPDPFAALGVPSNATSADIKSAYRKLALKCHPDKVADEALKKIKQEEFHKIQQAYELIGDDERLDAYRAELRLEAQRKAKLASRAASGPNVTRYETRTAAPAGSGVPHRYEERKPTASRSFEDDYYNNSRSKYYDTYEAQPSKQSSSPASSQGGGRAIVTSPPSPPQDYPPSPFPFRAIPSALPFQRHPSNSSSSRVSWTVLDPRTVSYSRRRGS